MNEWSEREREVQVVLEKSLAKEVDIVGSLARKAGIAPIFTGFGTLIFIWPLQLKVKTRKNS